jgi:hypothetical protein
MEPIPSPGIPCMAVVEEANIGQVITAEPINTKHPNSKYSTHTGILKFIFF